MTEEIKAFANAVQVEALADSLSLCADELHARVMRAIRKRPAAGDPARLDHDISQAAAQALFDTEVELRQRANSLYMDAASHAIAGMEASQKSVLDLTEAAQKTIRNINLLKDLIEIGTDLLGLAAAAVSGKPERIATALKKMKKYGAALATDKTEVY